MAFSPIFAHRGLADVADGVFGTPPLDSGRMNVAVAARAALARTATLAVATLFLAAAIAGPVLGHAALVTSDPADGAVLSASPNTITLTFDDDLAAAKSSFKLVGPSASRVVGVVTPGNPKVIKAANVKAE